MESTMKPPFPEVAPVIEIFPGVHATLLGDFGRFSNGKIPFGVHYMTAHSGGRIIGEIGANGGGQWIFKVEQAYYKVNMMEAFESVQNAHIASL